VGEFTVGGKIDRVRLQGGKLWVRHKHGGRVEIWNVTDPSLPSAVTELTGPAADFFGMKFQGSRAFSASGHRLSIHQVSALP
jgi:hypothetical protein